MIGRRRLRAKKPAVLQDKIKLATLIKNGKTDMKQLEYKNHPGGGYYWHGIWETPDGHKLRIYFQNYVRTSGVDYVDLKYEDQHRQLTVNQIKNLLKKYDNGKSSQSNS